MIKQKSIKNIEIDGTEKNFQLNISGKILKVLYRPISKSEITLKIMTHEGEEIVNVKEGGLFYPRANVSSQKMQIDSVDLSGDKTDYYYFKGLVFNITSNSPINEKVIDEIRIVYEE